MNCPYNQKHISKVLYKSNKTNNHAINVNCTSLDYVKPTLFKFLPNEANFGMDLVINRLLSKKRKVGVFPINEKDWKDVGNWTDYLNNIQTTTKAKIL